MGTVLGQYLLLRYFPMKCCLDNIQRIIETNNDIWRNLALDLNTLFLLVIYIG